MKIPNNQEKLVEKINKMNLYGVDAVFDDGSVFVRVSGTKERIWDVAKFVEAMFPESISVGDGAQDGDIFINNDELSDAVNKFF